MTLSIALVGDRNDEHVIAHRAIPRALEFANSYLGTNITWKWINTVTIQKDVASILSEFSAIWVVPGSPYENMEGVVNAIRYARETDKPFLGTCGGFQYALIEYVRNVCGVQEADHAETNGDGTALIVSPLSCSLIEKAGQINFTPGSILDSILGESSEREEYHCNYGLNPQWRDRLERVGMHFTGFDISGDVRACELPTHPFFIGTLFQPERAALQGKYHLLITAFVSSILKA
jgi:CTP synthase (UTP-ammonia lyase)